MRHRAHSAPFVVNVGQKESTMADIKTARRWIGFVPDIGDNQKQPASEQLVIEVATSLTKEELISFRDNISNPSIPEGKTPDEARIDVLAEVVRLKGTSHVIGGKPVNDIKDYLRVLLTLTDQYNIKEIFTSVNHFNSLQGSDALFSERRSGGTAFMLHRTAAQGESQTDEQ